MMFDQHELVSAQGMVAESFHPSDLSISAIIDGSRAELFMAFPDLRSDKGLRGLTARKCVKAHEARMLAA